MWPRAQGALGDACIRRLKKWRERSRLAVFHRRAIIVVAGNERGRSGGKGLSSPADPPCITPTLRGTGT